MTVQFQEDPVTLAEMFRPLIGRPYESPARFVLAVLVKGIVNEVPIDNIRDWLIRYGEWADKQPGVSAVRNQHGSDEDEEAPSNDASVNRASSSASLVRSRKTWLGLVESAVKKVDSSLLTRAQVAERLYATVLLPLPMEGLNIATQVNLRFTYVALTLQLLRSDLVADTVDANQDELAVSLGTSVRTQTNNIGLLRDLDLITKLSRAHRVGRYRVAAVSKRRREAIGQHDVVRESMSAFATDEPDAISVLLKSALHPAWTYGALTHQHLFLLVIFKAGLAPSDFGYRDRLVHKLRMDIERAGLLIPVKGGRKIRHRMIPLEQLIPTLDRLGDDPAYGRPCAEGVEAMSAREQHEAAMVARRAQAEQRKSVGMKREKQRQFVQNMVEDLLIEHKIPPLPTKTEEYLRRKITWVRPRNPARTRGKMIAHTFEPDPEDVLKEMKRRQDRLVKWRGEMRAAMSEYSFETESERAVGDQIARWLSHKLKMRGYGEGWVERNVQHIVYGTPLAG